MKLSSPRLIDIAERAGLSVTTISRILGGQRLSEYAPETQAKVRGIAEEMGWRPNLIVQGMKTGQTQTVGVFVAPFDTHWTGVLYGLHDSLLAARQVPLVLWPHALVHPTLNPEALQAWASGDTEKTDGTSETPEVKDDSAGSPRRELERIHCLEDRRVDAIISWPLHEKDARERLTMLSARGWRVVMIDDDLPQPAKPIRIGSDEAGAMRQSLEHLQSLGHRRVAYIGLEREHGWIHVRHEIFRQEAQRLDESHQIEVSGPSYGHHHRIGPFLREHPQITAVVAGTDHVARQTIIAARNLGRRVPEDLSVVGFGNDVFGQGDVPLTTIDQKPYDLGRVAAELATRTPVPRQRKRVVPTQLIVRRSTGPCPTAD